jgi:thiamine biosynthesis lipoprotein
MSAEPRKLTRRRTLFIGATLLGSAIIGRVLGDTMPVARWSGQALGAHASIELVGLHEAEAAPLFASVEQELARLEAIFSLYRSDSAVSVLNRDAVLHAPPPELLEVMALSAAAHGESFGLFDPTVQPLFALYATHYAAGNAAPPASEMVEATLERVGLEKVVVAADAIRFTAAGMGLTLNGIAQGYITDKVATLLRGAGLGNLLIDMGEIRAIGEGRTGNGWRIGLRAGPEDDTVIRHLTLNEGAVATSMMLGTTLDGGGSAGHILHPRRGLVTAFNPRTTVVAATAARADALSTAAVLMDAGQLAALRDRGVELYL